MNQSGFDAGKYEPLLERMCIVGNKRGGRISGGDKNGTPANSLAYPKQELHGFRGRRGLIPSEFSSAVAREGCKSARGTIYGIHGNTEAPEAP